MFEGDKQTLDAKEIIVATGSSPRSVPAVQIDHQRIITSDEAIHLKEVPKSLVIMGSGAVGVEFASIYRRFGSEVTIIELLPRLVPGRGRGGVGGAREVVQEAGHHGADRHEGDQGDGRRPTASTIEAQGADGKTQTISAELLLVATGRGPVTTGLGAEDARHRDGDAATSRWTSCIARRCPTCRRSAT